MARVFRSIIILLCISGFIFAQLPNSFTELAHYDPDNYALQGKAYDVVVSEDSLIFTAFGEAGIYVHQLVESKLIYKSHIRDGANHRNLLLSYDGSLLSATTSDGIHAYGCHDGLLIEQAILDTNIRTYRMVQGPDSTIFMANGNRGLFAYKFDGSQFDFLSFIDQGGSALGIAYRLDSTVFLANRYDGIRIYKFDGNDFTSLGHLLLTEDECYDYHASDITLLNDSTVASCGSQINVYHYNDSSIVETHGYYLPKSAWNPNDLYNYNLGERIVSKGNAIYVSVQNEGLYSFNLNSLYAEELVGTRQATSHGTCLANNMIFHANEDCGLFVYNESDLALLDNYSLSEQALSLRKGPNNSFYLASGIGGVKAFRFENGSFELLDEAGTGCDVTDVAASDDGHILSTVNKYNGLKVYEFTNETMSLIFEKKFSGQVVNAVDWATNYSTEISSDNKLYFGYYYRYDDLIHDQNDITYGAINCYNIDGTNISYNSNASYVDYNSFYPNDICADQQGNLFVSFNSDGLKELSHMKSVDAGGKAEAVDVSSAGIVYLANGYDGIRSYDFDTSFYEIGHIDDGGEARGLTSKGANMVFLANGNDGLRAYIHEDSMFTCQAQFSSEGYAEDIIVLSDCTLVLADGYNGLIALSFNGWDSLKTEFPEPDPGDDPEIPDSYKLNQNYPNPFNPITTISYQLPASSNVELAVYDISGRKINQWSYINQAAGTYEITWNGKDQHGNPVPSGVYIYRMLAGDFVESKKMVLLK